MSTSQTDPIVVVGSGLAGLSAALTVASRGRRAIVVTKTRLASGSSPLAQGGLAAAVGRSDRPELHAADTERVGRGLCDRDVVRLLTESAPSELHALLERGARLDRDQRSELSLGREAGHGLPRIVHAGGDRTGRELVRVLANAVRAEPRIEIREGVFVSDVLRLQNGRVGGVLAGSGVGAFEIRGAAVVLATGGAGQLYRYTTNPVEVTGDGIAMAARAGALLADLEMVQFHPTALAAAAPGEPLTLLTEALRGAGALLVDREGRRFLAAEHPDAELAPRDVLARALWKRAVRGEESYLDLRPICRNDGELAKRFPGAAAACAAAGIEVGAQMRADDPSRCFVPVTCAAHYFIGGVWTDSWGRTSLPGLYACGETAATGAHGANRLASNSLLEALVFGRRVGESVLTLDMRAHVGRDQSTSELRDGTSCVVAASALDARRAVAEIRTRLQDAMWRGAGVVRDEPGLLALDSELRSFGSRLPAGGSAAGEVRNLLLLGRLVAAAALRRRESRGCHFRADHPEERAELCERPRYTAQELLGRTPESEVAAAGFRA